jgi:hypothetical protein
MKDYNNDGERDDYDGLRWDDEENGGRGFREWESFDHPTLGKVELGGFHPKFFGQNGPTWQLENWASKQALFNLAMAFELPQLTLDKLEVKPKKDTYTITVKFTNTGNLPVALKQAQLVKIVQEDRIKVDFDKELLKGGKDAKVKIITPALYDKTIYTGYAQPGQSKEVTFEVSLNGLKGAKGKVKILSTRGGYIEKEIVLGELQ